jgi:hypothetical protein
MLSPMLCVKLVFVHTTYTSFLWYSRCTDPLSSDHRIAAGMLLAEFKTPWNFLAEMPAQARAAGAAGSKNGANKIWWTLGDTRVRIRSRFAKQITPSIRNQPSDRFARNPDSPSSWTQTCSVFRISVRAKQFARLRSTSRKLACASYFCLVVLF